MTTRHDIPESISAEALFRHLVIGQVRVHVLCGRSRAQAIREVAAQPQARLDGSPRRVSVRTLQRWLRAFEDGGIAALELVPRRQTETSVVLPGDLIEFVRLEKRSDPAASIPELIDRARERGVICADLAVDRTTLWRACKRMGLPTTQRPRKTEGDCRRFEHTHRMRCIIADGKHFRAGPGRLKRVALFFLDDATRYCLGVVVGPSESTELFLTGLHQVVESHGLMDIVFLDKGPGFRSNDTAAVVWFGLGALWILGSAGYPEGRGKIERFNRTMWARTLRSLNATHVDADYRALELRLRHAIERYNDRYHETLKCTPRERWEADPHPLRFPEDAADLDRRFVITESRKVSADHVIKHGGKLWEAPRGLACQSVEIRRNAIDGCLHLPHRGRLVRLHEVDLHANAQARRSRRGYQDDDQPLPGEGVPVTADELAFRRDFSSIVGSDGGFSDHSTEED